MWQHFSFAKKISELTQVWLNCIKKQVLLCSSSWCFLIWIFSNVFTSRYHAYTDRFCRLFFMDTLLTQSLDLDCPKNLHMTCFGEQGFIFFIEISWYECVALCDYVHCSVKYLGGCVWLGKPTCVICGAICVANKRIKTNFFDLASVT